MDARSNRIALSWWRDEWVHVEAHEDVDEYLFESTGERRYPEHAHVLYLTVGRAIRAPTCVWDRTHEHAPRSGTLGELSIVPARTGRLLRFNGKRMHGVPRPTLRWLPLSSRNEGVSAVSSTEGSSSQRPTKDDLVRSVVLFNTWAVPPLDVETADGAADPREVIRKLAADFSSPKIDALVEVMETPDTHCTPRDQWHAVQIERAPAGRRAREPVKVWLLGDKERRLHAERTIELVAHEDLARALQEEVTVTSLGV